MRTTVADALVSALKRDGVRHVFGVPGGGSSLDIIRACGGHGIDFVVTRTETAAVIMAAVTAELRGSIGVALTTRGPGVASAANGLAYASLERAPVMLVSDGWSPAASSYDTHQVFDQAAMLAPVVKARGTLDGDDPGAEIASLIRIAKARPAGAVFVELSAEVAARRIRAVPAAGATENAAPAPAGDVEGVRGHLSGARKPVVIVGLEARETGIAARVRKLADALACPVFTTYKARGVLADGSDWLVGNFTGGALERACVGEADLIVLVGLDPVELIGQPWPYSSPVVEIAARQHPVHYVTAVAAIRGPLAEGLDLVGARPGASKWTLGEIRGHRARMRRAIEQEHAEGALTADAVVDAAVRLAGADRPRITVDAGAHMFSAMSRWPCAGPDDALISNCLSTMGFALPAALASSIADPGRRVIAFTGDGGLMMCMGELSTLAQHGRKVCIVVLNDGAYSMIRLKQAARQLPRAGMEWPRADFAAVAAGFGIRARRAESPEGYLEALAEALAGDAPALIDAVIDPAGYPAQARAMRG